MSNLSLPEFPNSSSDPFWITSPKTYKYNCIAWAYGSTNKWFWPDQYFQAYWPPGIPRQETLDAFIKLYESIGFEICNDESFEAGFEKIVILCDNFGIPTHACKLLQDGKWSSKLGSDHDVSHSLNSIVKGAYGNVSTIMRRKQNSKYNLI